jgi:2-polyprenyl-3-methyl-5-hydroxy-6-metoxy-1,4-benzoquinol methylase
MKEPKQLVWTDEYIGRFWNYMAYKPNADQKYFTFQVGGGVVNFLKNFIDLDGKKILDFGCGKGFLIDQLLKSNAEVWGLDYSSESIESVNNKFKNNTNWRGGTLGLGDVTTYEDDFFDIIVCVETIEHVHANYLEGMFKEFFRLLKPGGKLLLTTPNNEILEKNFVYCPSCDSVYHRMQHIRSWTESSLKSYLFDFKFQPEFVQGVNFKTFDRRPVFHNSILDLSPRKLFQLFEYLSYRALTLTGYKKGFFNYQLKKFNNRAHLAAIATK